MTRLKMSRDIAMMRAIPMMTSHTYMRGPLMYAGTGVTLSAGGLLSIAVGVDITSWIDTLLR